MLRVEVRCPPPVKEGRRRAEKAVEKVRSGIAIVDLHDIRLGIVKGVKEEDHATSVTCDTALLFFLPSQGELRGAQWDSTRADHGSMQPSPPPPSSPSRLSPSTPPTRSLCTRPRRQSTSASSLRPIFRPLGTPFATLPLPPPPPSTVAFPSSAPRCTSPHSTTCSSSPMTSRNGVSAVSVAHQRAQMMTRREGRRARSIRG